jgi:hypothetical protein
MASFKRGCLGLMLWNFALLAPAIVQAGGNYAGFLPDQNKMRAVLSDTYVRCAQLSGVNMFAKKSCDDDELARLDRRIYQMHLARMTQISDREASDVRIQYRIWLRNADNYCLNEFERDRGSQGTPFGPNAFESPTYSADVAQCRLEEYQRRVVWTESLS